MKKLKQSVKKYAHEHYAFSYIIACVLCAFFRKRYAEKLKHAMDIFVQQKLNRKQARELERKLIAHRLTYQIDYEEFFLLLFNERNDAGKRSFIGDIERQHILERFGTPTSREIFDNKYSTYKRFQKYYGREIILVSSESDKSSFDSFIKRHDHILVKPTKLSFGKGVYHVLTRMADFSPDDLFHKIIADGEHIIEEYIVQCDELSEFHPDSVNTVRFTSWYNGNKMVPLYSFFRMGRNGNVVDNAGSGGVFASVDTETGIVITPAVDKSGNRYYLHPDTNKKIIGYQIPQWDELISLVTQIVAEVPEQKYVGWDLALTKDGWIIVEGNRRGQFVQQYADQKGCRHLLSLMQ